MKVLTWEEFRRSGMFWFINRTLAAFGYVLVYDGTEVYPALIHEIGLEDDEADTAREVFLSNIKPWKRPRITDPSELPESDRELIEKLEKMG